jgi:colicin import membrane protein
MQDDMINLRAMIFYSFCLHIAVLTLVAFLPAMPVQHLTFGPVYSVQLVSTSEILSASNTAFSSTREFIGADYTGRTVILKKNVDVAPTVPIKLNEAPKRQSGVVDKVLESLRKAAATKRTEDALPPRAAAQGGGSLDKQESLSDRSMDVYNAGIWARIKGQWVFPQDLSRGANIYAVVNIRILKNGAVTDVNFERRSGNRYFDESALRAIRKASPFPRLPESAGDGGIELGIRFHSSELR